MHRSGSFHRFVAYLILQVHSLHLYIFVFSSSFLASATTVISLLSTIILAWMDRRAERLLKRRDNQSGEVVRITDIKDFPFSFWMIALVCVAYYVAIFPFIALGK